MNINFFLYDCQFCITQSEENEYKNSCNQESM